MGKAIVGGRVLSEEEAAELVANRDMTFGINIMANGKWKPKRGKTTQNISFGYAKYHYEQKTKLGEMCQITHGGEVVYENRSFILSAFSMAYLRILHEHFDSIQEPE